MTVRTVALRGINQRRVRFAMPAFELERTDDHVVLHIPVGAEGQSRNGPRIGPRGGFLAPDAWEPGYFSRAWRSRDVVMVHRFGDEWSTWRWVMEDRTWTAGAYINLERDWVSTTQTWDTEDLTLDVVLGADRSLTYKDEHELAWAVAEGHYSSDEAARIKEIGQRAYAHAAADGWPLTAEWDRWLPDSSHLPTLPAQWGLAP